MGENSDIEWTHHTFNPWIGCMHVSPGCDHCYAEAQDHRWGHDRWGSGKPREVTSDANWRKPLAWNRRAALLGIRERVFCASLADVFDNEAPVGAASAGARRGSPARGVNFAYRRAGTRLWTRFFLKDETATSARADGPKIAAAHEKATARRRR